MTETDKKNAAMREDIANVLIVDNDTELARAMLEVMARKGIRGYLVSDIKKAGEFVCKSRCDLVFISDNLEQTIEGSRRSQSGFELLENIKTNWPEMPIIMTAGAQNQKSQNQQRIIETAVRAVRRGCCDFAAKPLSRERIENLLDTYLPNHGISTIETAHENMNCLYHIVGKSASLFRTVDLARRVAPTSAPVLISGESGTGKELLAYYIHHNSKRAQGSYIKINCAALNESLLESELFGHEKGAFTGAYMQRKGRFEMAHGGTLLLDEISETPIRFQAKLLRVLEQQDFERVGGNESVRVNVRIISTTNKNLLHEIRRGRFRQDLYYRLSGVRLVISPLRERTDDLRELVWYFINLYAREISRRITRLDPAMMDILAKYHWPGNVRQLRNVVRTSLILGFGETLSLADVSWLFDELQPLIQEGCGNIDSSRIEHEIGGEDCSYTDMNVEQNNEGGLGGVPLVQIERRAIIDTLRQTGGNQTKAAKVLGISDRTLRDRIQRYKKEGCLQAS